MTATTPPPSSSTHVWFVVAILCGLSANIGLMELNAMHRGCANTCTLSQFGFGLFESLLNKNKRKFLLDGKERKLALSYHGVFALMFFAGPFCGNMSITITMADFYPVFLVLRACGSVPSMGLGYLFAGQLYNAKQVLFVFLITAGIDAAPLPPCAQ